MAITGGFDNSVIGKVQQANDIVDIVSEHISLTKKGREMLGYVHFTKTTDQVFMSIL